MPNLRVALTDRAIAKLSPAEVGQYIVRDTELKGFYVLVGKKSRRYMVQGDLRREGEPSASVKISVGDVSTITAQAARTIAKGYLSELGQGRHPKPHSVRSRTVTAHTQRTPETDGSPITLRGAWARYLESHMLRKGRSARTIAGYRDHVERVFKDWLDTPLRDLADDADRVARRHDELTKQKGPYGANGAMRTLRAIYNHAWSKNKKALPRDNPADAIDWNPEERRNTAMGMKDLYGWFDELIKMENPIRREFHLFVLLSGSRPTAIKMARVEHLDLSRRVLHVPTPKGGSKRAFDIPLSRQMISCLIRAMRFGHSMHAEEAQDWIFAAGSKSGHIEVHKEKRRTTKDPASSRKKTVLSKWGNDLRQTYRTLATMASVSEVDAKLLMNHAISGVNAGYITRDKIVADHLRGQQQLISNVMFIPVADKIHKPGKINGWLGPRASVKAISQRRV